MVGVHAQRFGHGLSGLAVQDDAAEHLGVALGQAIDRCAEPLPCLRRGHDPARRRAHPGLDARVFRGERMDRSHLTAGVTLRRAQRTRAILELQEPRLEEPLPELGLGAQLEAAVGELREHVAARRLSEVGRGLPREDELARPGGEEALESGQMPLHELRHPRSVGPVRPRSFSVHRHEFHGIAVAQL